ncbi:MAG: hypothetical protein K2J50_00535, partial [Treponemataceae bacterium]|nr:hypothetical protein [Treponemataceae bacterium]
MLDKFVFGRGYFPRGFMYRNFAETVSNVSQKTKACLDKMYTHNVYLMWVSNWSESADMKNGADNFTAERIAELRKNIDF